MAREGEQAREIGYRYFHGGTDLATQPVSFLLTRTRAHPPARTRTACDLAAAPRARSRHDPTRGGARRAVSLAPRRAVTPIVPTLGATFAFATTEHHLLSSIVGSPPTFQQAKYLPGFVAARAHGYPAHPGGYWQLRAPRSKPHPLAGLGARVDLALRPSGCRAVFYHVPRYPYRAAPCAAHDEQAAAAARLSDSHGRGRYGDGHDRSDLPRVPAR
eukprot:6204811-Pleurochrysis_carterae.AAC.4